LADKADIYPMAMAYCEVMMQSVCNIHGTCQNGETHQTLLRLAAPTGSHLKCILNKICGH